MSQLPITITGHLTHEPELIKVNADMYKARLRVASSRRIPVDNADNGVREWRDTDLIYIDVELWGQFAINVKKSLHRGMPVIVVGSVCSDSWLAPDGQNRFRTFIKAFYVGLDLNRYVISSRKLERVYETDGLEAPASGETMPEVDVDRTESMAAGAGAQAHDDKHDTTADRRQAAHSKANAAEETFEEAEAPAEQSVGS